jgi:hypothetical protein
MNIVNIKLAFCASLAVLALIGTALGQELDGTLKKIQTTKTFTIGYRESAQYRPA